MTALTSAERACLARYVDLLRERLGERLLAVRLFGSAARGDMWPAHSPMHSDIDLLVITSDDVVPAQEEELLNATYELYLECGRQLSPHFFSRANLDAPADARQREFFAAVAREGSPVWEALTPYSPRP